MESIDNDFTNDQIHRIRLEQNFFFTIAELCERWQITRYRLRKWKKLPYRSTLEDCVVAALYRSPCRDPADLCGWLDYCNHAAYSADEVRQLLDNLERYGEVTRETSTWIYTQVDPPYIFGPRDTFEPVKLT